MSESRNRYQIRFTKSGPLRWISHRDLARLWERTVRRAGVRIAMSEGFSPKAKISFPTALALGIESQDEVVELELIESPTAAELSQRLAADNVPGLRITQVDWLEPGTAKSQFAAGHYVLTPASDQPWDESVLQQRIEQLWTEDTICFLRKHKEVQASAREQIQELELREGKLWITLRASRTASLRPQDVLAALDLATAIEDGARLVRIRTELDHEPAHQSEQANAPL